MHAGAVKFPLTSTEKAETSVQALDLTDLDWAAELWIMRYDNDQHNARLAQHVFDDNALDVPESFFDTLRPFLGKYLHPSSLAYLKLFLSS